MVVGCGSNMLQNVVIEVCEDEVEMVVYSE